MLFVAGVLSNSAPPPEPEYYIHPVSFSALCTCHKSPPACSQHIKSDKGICEGFKLLFVEQEKVKSEDMYSGYI